MRIKRIELENFTVHKHTELELAPSGINLITGENGSGKSSIVQAIFVSLFGKALYYRKIEELVRMGEKDFSITLEIEGNDAIRTVRRTRNTLVCYPLTVKGSSEFKEILYKLFSITQNNFTETFLVKQHEVASFVRNTPKNRYVIYERITGISELKKLSQIVEQKLKFYRNYLKDMDEHTLLSRKKELAARMENLKRSISEAHSQLERTKENLKALENQRKELENELRIILQVRSLESSLKEMEAKLEKTKRIYEQYIQLEPYKHKLELYDSLRSKLSGYDELSRKLEKLKEGARKYEMFLELLKDEAYEELSSILARGKQLKEILKRSYGDNFAIRIPEIYENFLKYKQKLEKLQPKLESLDLRIKELKRYIRELENLRSDKCPLCRRTMDESHRRNVLESYRKELSRTIESRRKLEATINQLETFLRKHANVERLKELLEEYLGYMERVAKDPRLSSIYELYKRVKGYSRYEKDYREFREVSVQLEALENHRKEAFEIRKFVESSTGMKLEEVSDFLRRYEKDYQEHVKLMHAVSKRKEELLNLKAKLNASYSYEEVESKLENVRNLISRESIALGKLETEIRKNREILSELENQYEELIRELERIRRTKFYVDVLKDMLEKLLGYMDAIHGRYNAHLSRLVWSYFSRFSLHDYNGVFIEIRNNEFDVKVSDHSGVLRDAMQLSGGEKVALSLAFRLAFAKLLGIKFRTFILDEPTEGLDDVRMESLKDILREFVRGLDMQVILITHEASFKDVANRTFLLERRGNQTILAKL